MTNIWVKSFLKLDFWIIFDTFPTYKDLRELIIFKAPYDPIVSSICSLSTVANTHLEGRS